MPCRFAFAKFLHSSVKLEQFAEIIHVKEEEELEFVGGGDFGFFSTIKGFFALEKKEENRVSTIQIFGQTEVVGFGSWLYPDTMMPHRLVSLAPGSLAFLTKENTDLLLNSFPKLNDLLVGSLCEINFLYHRRISDLGSHSVRSRVASALICLSERFGQKSSSGIFLNVPLNRIRLSSLSGTSPESLSRMLTEMEKSGVIQRDRRRLIVRDVNQLQEIRSIKF